MSRVMIAIFVVLVVLALLPLALAGWLLWKGSCRRRQVESRAGRDVASARKVDTITPAARFVAEDDTDPVMGRSSAVVLASNEFIFRMALVLAFVVGLCFIVPAAATSVHLLVPGR